VHIKLKSTTNKEGPDTSNAVDGLLYDGYGYSVTLDHFLGLLRCPKLVTFVEEVREIVGTPTNDQKNKKSSRRTGPSSLVRDGDDDGYEDEAEGDEGEGAKRLRTGEVSSSPSSADQV
jgi:hypothetical protein